MKYLMIFSIGPVQDFIATARRSRDLWYGSWMLSELSKAVAKNIAELTSFDNLIFPHPNDKKLLEPASDFNSPNKIVAVIETDNPKQFAEDIKTAVCTYLIKELAEKTIESLPLKEENKKLAYRQIEDLPEVYWVSVPYNGRKYDVVRDEAEATLIARKATRDFKQMIGANVPKSSLDGSRESVIDEGEYLDNKKDTEEQKEEKIKSLYDNYNARQGERLSGVDLLKRLGEKNKKDEKGKNIQPDFKSTSHMAAIPFMEKLEEQKATDLIKEIRKWFDVTKRKVGEKDEGSLLFENRILDSTPSNKKIKDSTKSFNEIFTRVTGSDSRPNPYYALLRADGDFMGKVIDAQESEEAHRDLSKILSDFATESPKIVEKNKGLLIYSGGDDVLAYLPITTALQCANELEKAFREAFSKPEEKGIKVNIQPTLSVGIVIAHHLDPLSDVLQLAREAEHKAKQIENKNGLGITLSKRSGVDRTIVDKFSKLHERVDVLKKLFDSKLISGGTAYEFHELHRTLSETIPKEGVIQEALRILNRKKESSGDNISDDTKAKLTNWISNISLEDLANEMIIAKALADGGTNES